MFGLGKKKGQTLGLHISSAYISVVQLDKTKLGIELTRYADIPTPPNTVREGLIADPETVGAVVQDCLAQAGIMGGAPPVLNTAVPGQSVVIRLMPVPTGMPPDELTDVVTQEAINHVPFPLKEANLDWSIMPATERTDPDGVRRVDVILAAVQKTIVDSYWQMVESAGATLGRLDISSLATIRALAFSGYLDQPNQLTVSVNIRHEATDINLIRSGMPLFSRSVLLGLDTLGEAVSRSLDISGEDAVNLLPQIQLFGMASVDPRTGQAAQIVRTVFGDITDEVGRSLEFYRSQVGDVKIDQIVLCGPGSTVPQLEEFMSNRLNISTVLANPFRVLAGGQALVPENRAAADTMVAGCAVEPGWSPVITVDLDLNKEGPSTGALEKMEARPTVRIIEEDTPWFLPAAAGGVIATLAVGGIWFYTSQFDAPNKQAEATRLTDEITKEKKQLADMGKLGEANALLQRKKQLLDDIVRVGHPRAALLKAIADSVPDGVQLTKVTITSKSIKIEGDANEFNKVSDLVLNLQGSPLLTDSQVSEAKRDTGVDPRVIKFIVTSQVGQNAPSIAVPNQQPVTGPAQPGAGPNQPAAGSSQPTAGSNQPTAKPPAAGLTRPFGRTRQSIADTCTGNEVR